MRATTSIFRLITKSLLGIMNVLFFMPSDITDLTGGRYRDITCNAVRELDECAESLQKNEALIATISGKGLEYDRKQRTKDLIMVGKDLKKALDEQVAKK